MLRVGKFLISEEVNGPGKRFVIWFQGCPLRCNGCFNPEFWDENKGMNIEPKGLMHYIKSAKGIEGVTFTGGEPFLQAEKVILLAQMIKAENLGIVCYSGYTLEEILNNVMPCSKYIDMLIDGRYSEKEKIPLLWRGSSNQKVYFFTERYRYLEHLIFEKRSEVEIKVGEDNIVMTGIFDTGIWNKLNQRLKKGRKNAY